MGKPCQLDPSPTRPPRVAVASLAVIGLLVAALAPPPPASAVEFPPVPKVTSTQTCIDGNYSMEVTITMANDGAGTAHFHLEWGNTLNGNGVGGGQQDFEVTDTPFKAIYEVAEGYAATYTVTSADGPGVDFSLDVPAVDCRANPVASVAVVCPSLPGDVPPSSTRIRTTARFPWTSPSSTTSDQTS